MSNDNIKAALFIKANAALSAYQATVAVKYPSAEAERQHDRFRALYEIIEAACLTDEFEAWKMG